MAARKLAAMVLVHNEDGTSTAYGPESDVPADAAKKIVNPKAWADDKQQAARSDK